MSSTQPRASGVKTVLGDQYRPWAEKEFNLFSWLAPERTQAEFCWDAHTPHGFV